MPLVTWLVSIILLLEVYILVKGSRAGIPKCCCLSDAVISQVPTENEVQETTNQGFETDIARCEETNEY